MWAELESGLAGAGYARLDEDDPAAFAAGVLGHDLWSMQRAILEAIRVPHARVAVKSANGVGKTFLAAALVLWWVRAGGKSFITAPTGTQVQYGIWGEIHRQYARAVPPLGGVLNQTDWRLDADRFALGVATNQGIRFEGYHGTILVVVDETPGVLPAILEAIRGLRAAGDVRVLLLGNPLVPSGPFYEAFTSGRAAWTTFSISAFDTPNLAGLAARDLATMAPAALDLNPRPYLVSRRWVREMLDDLGEDSPIYQARVLARFPAQAEDALIGLAWLEAARTAELPPTGDLVAGVDVAGPGEDETVLCLRQGPRIVSLHAWAQADPRGALLAALAPYRGRCVVQVDSIGIGYYLAAHLRDAGHTVREINVGLPAADPAKYANRKAEYYWGLRQRFQAGQIAGLADERAIGQLAGIRYRHDPRGRIVIEPKEEARRRGVKSPDRAEAILLAFAADVDPPLPFGWYRAAPPPAPLSLEQQLAQARPDFATIVTQAQTLETDEERIARRMRARGGA